MIRERIMLAFCLKVLRSPQVKAPERIWECNSWMHQTTHHSFGWVARLILTVVTPMLKSASALNAAFVRSTCLEPWAQPAHVSITRTNIHLFLLLHTVEHKRTPHDWRHQVCHVHSRNSKQFGRSTHPFKVRAQANDSSWKRWINLFYHSKRLWCSRSVPNCFWTNNSDSEDPDQCTFDS